MFFRESYKTTFDFDDPPLHDPLTIAYILRPDLFETAHYRVDIETTSRLCAGQTIVDIRRQSGMKIASYKYNTTSKSLS